MSTSEGGKVADALLADLNGDVGDFSKYFEAELGYGLRLKLDDADTLHVDVAPVRTTSERVTRGQIKWTSIIDVGVRYRFGPSDRHGDTGTVTNAAVEEYRYLLQEIVQWYYKKERLTSYDSAVIEDDADVRVDVVQKHFEEWSQFTGIARLQYRTETEIA